MEKKETEKETIEEQLVESGLEFAKQFNPASEAYHHGSQVPVPIGGKKIPIGMTSEIDPNYEEAKKSFDAQENNPEYQKISKIREHFTQLKMQLNKLCVPYEAILRHHDIFKTKGNANNEKHLETLNKNIANEKKKLEETLEKIKESQQFITNLGNVDYEKMLEQLKEVLKNTDNQEFLEKETLSNYQFAVKKVSQQAFAEANRLLQELKKIKGIEIKKPQKPVESIQQNESP